MSSVLLYLLAFLCFHTKGKPLFIGKECTFVLTKRTLLVVKSRLLLSSETHTSRQVIVMKR